jgi:hypothetical protein
MHELAYQTTQIWRTYKTSPEQNVYLTKVCEDKISFKLLFLDLTVPLRNSLGNYYDKKSIRPITHLLDLPILYNRF